MAQLIWITLSLAFIGCNGDSSEKVDSSTEVDIEDTSVQEVYGTCGDGMVNHPDEECDDGENNSNVADSCRVDCISPKCGDSILDSNEDCDDGNLVSVDGCTDECLIEEGSFEIEPNDTVQLGNPLTGNGSIKGRLWENDQDCYTFDIQDNDYMHLQFNTEQEECSYLMALHVYHDLEHQDTIVSTDDTCSELNPQEHSIVRFMQGSESVATTVCIEGWFGTPVEEYTMEWEVFSDSCTLTDLELTDAENPDGDLQANNCDDDDDDDGIPDLQDNCRVIANNGLMEYTPDEDGFFRNWVLTSAFQVTGISTSGCLPLPDLFSIDEASVYPSLDNTFLDYNEDLVHWSLYNSNASKINFLDIPTLEVVGPPREVFAGIWVYSSSYRAVNAMLGSDDGGKVWVNGVLIGENQNCHGATIDNYSFPTTLNAGWNRVLIQIRDGGGGWGMYFRFSESGIPVTDLQLSPMSSGVFVDHQTDSDGDGIGDQCDLPD